MSTGEGSKVAPSHTRSAAARVAGSRQRWRLREGPVTGDLRAADYPPLVRRLLANRGIATAAQARAFLHGAPDGLADPFSLPGMASAVERTTAAIGQGELIAVYGDFDVDGVTAAALLTEGLASLGGRAVVYLPDRFREGYGLHGGAVESLRRQGVSLLITADCGTSAVAEIDLARSLGMDVIVVDHHHGHGRLPDVSAMLNPHAAGGDAPHTELSAAGLAFQLLRAVHDSLGRPFEAADWLDLVALGTVVDMAPLVGENRELVRRGLRALSETERPGLRALMSVAGVQPARFETEALSYALGPRLNAAGRIRHARLAYDLLVMRDEEAALDIARQLNELNRERQRRTEAALDTAHSILDRPVAEDREASLIMLGHPSFSAGIVGLVATRLAQELYRPTVVYEEGRSSSRASARSIPEFDIMRALWSCAELFERFGGHRQAAGFTAANQRLLEIRRHLQRYAAEALASEELAPTIEMDAALALSAIRGEEIRWLALFAPCGPGNPRPAFLSQDVLLVEARPIGAREARHYRLKLRDGPLVWPAVLWGQRRRESPDDSLSGLMSRAPCRVDAVYAFSADQRTGSHLELEVLDLRPSADDTH